VHDQKKVDIGGQEITLIDRLVWPGVATLGGLPATVVPIDRTADGLHIMGAQFEDRTTIAFAGLIEREFGGFQAPLLVAQALSAVGRIEVCARTSASTHPEQPPSGPA
jgi:amidase